MVLQLRMRRDGMGVEQYGKTLFAVQLTCWLLAAAFYLITQYWLGFFVAVVLAGATFGYSRLRRLSDA